MEIYFKTKKDLMEKINIKRKEKLNGFIQKLIEFEQVRKKNYKS